MIWYKTAKHSTAIEEVIVSKATDRMLVVVNPWRNNAELRTAKHSGHADYFPTWEEAHEFLTQRTTRQLEWARNRLAEAEADIAAVAALTKPEHVNA